MTAQRFKTISTPSHLALVMGALLAAGCQVGSSGAEPVQIVPASSETTDRTGATSWEVYDDGPGSLRVLAVNPQRSVVAEAVMSTETETGMLRVATQLPERGEALYAADGTIVEDNRSERVLEWMDALSADMMPGPDDDIAYFHSCAWWDVPCNWGYFFAMGRIRRTCLVPWNASIPCCQAQRQVDLGCALVVMCAFGPTFCPDMVLGQTCDPAIANAKRQCHGW